MRLSEREISIPIAPSNANLFHHFSDALKFRLADNEIPLRFAAIETTGSHHLCEVTVLENGEELALPDANSVFEIFERNFENKESFNVVLLVPTGIGAEIGGHAGDATPVARLLGSVCDTLITHPNVVNASDINQMPENSLYVEGSVICRLLLGQVGLQPVRANRVLVVMDFCHDEMITNLTVNAVNAAHATYALDASTIIKLDRPLMMSASYTSSGRAAGHITGLDNLFSVLTEFREDFDAVAITSMIDVPPESYAKYYSSEGEMTNPWGGVEAMLTHAISTVYDVPSAHSPLLPSQEVVSLDPGEVEPRMAAEAISTSFLQSILMGLQRSPKIISGAENMRKSETATVEDVSCLVIPQGCLGIPTLAALEQGIPVIEVKENKNLMKNDLSILPWKPGHFYSVENYWEAAGVIDAMRAGITPESVRRPLRRAELVIGGTRDTGIQSNGRRRKSTSS